MKNNKKQGFTLVEVIIVIGMLVVLAGILLPKLTGYISQVRKFEIVEQARKVVIAVESVNIKNPNAIKTNQNSPTISSILTLTSGLLEESDINKLNPDTNKIQDCYNLIEHEKYTFTLDENNYLSKVEPIK